MLASSRRLPDPRTVLVVAALVVTGAACAVSFGEERSSVAGSNDAASDAVDALPVFDAALADADVQAPVVGSVVSGEVVFVDAGDAGRTTVILAPESFDVDAFHDKVPAGPRATDVTGAWTIGDVPAGTYFVLAGYEQDGLVLDPSTPPPKVVVSGAAGETVTVASPQKLVRALRVVSIESIASSAKVTLVDVTDEDAYEVSVIDWQSKPIYAATEPASASNANVTFAIDAGLVVPLKYRFRVTAKKAGAIITQTEDLATIRTAAPDDT